MSNRDFLVYHYPQTDSTNLQASALLADKVGEKTQFVIRADYQRQGRGQGGNSWESPKGENLLCSFMLYPDYLRVDNWFYLSKVASLAVHDLLKNYFSQVYIKWPNDILVKRKKIAGILIENSLQNRTITHSITGIGLNVNQSVFPEYPMPATSMKNENGRDFLVEEVFESLIDSYSYWSRQLLEEDFENIDQSYLEHLYRLNEVSKFRAAGTAFEARLVGVKDDGRLMLDAGEKDLLLYGFKEVEFL